jgi:hypothetical protein
MPQVLTATQDCPLEVTKVTDRKGNPAQVENARWSSSDPSVLEIIQDPDNPLRALEHAVGPPGPVLVTFLADADLGTGVLEIIGTWDVVVTAGQAAIVEISAGTPIEQAPPAGRRR